jgi:hypothetical protein
VKYLLMHKAIPVLLMDLDEGTGTVVAIDKVFEPVRVPVGIELTGGVVDRIGLNEWWTGRSIPASRSGLRDALEAMNVSSPQVLLTKCFGLSLSDQYWAKPEGTNLKWEDINFFDNAFSEDVGNILFGQLPDGDAFSLMSPDNTSDGWLRKKWKVIDGKRCLIKGGSGATRQEPYNEVLASEIMQRLSVSHAPYTLTFIDEYPYSVCEDFITSKTELISAWHIMQTKKRNDNTSSYRHFLNCCDALKIPDVREALDKMLAVDYIIANEDRHFNNFGAVRNADTLKWTGLAPIFDCGTSLYYDKPTTMIRPYDKSPSKPFRGSHDEQIKLVGDFGWYDFSALNGLSEVFSDILTGSSFIDDARRDALCQGLETRAEMLSDYIRSRQRDKSERQHER